MGNRKIAMFLPNLGGGGAEKMRVHLARSFSQHGYSVDFVLADASGPYVPLVPPSVRIVGLGARRVITSFPGLVRYLRQERPDVLLSGLTYANVVAVWARRFANVPTRLILSEHNNLSEATRGAEHFKARVIRSLVRACYSWADDLIAVSKGVATDLAASLDLGPEAIRVIYNPVLTPELLRMADEPVDHPWFMDDKVPVILSAGRLVPQKDFPTLIHAFAHVRKIIRARLMILGEGRERVRLEQLISQLGLSEDVSLEGFKSNPYAYMKRASVFVLSSAWEGFGNVLVEAMATGTPVVATDCRSGPSEILDGGRYGRLVEVGNARQLASAILATLEAPIPACVLQERARDFCVERIAREYLKVLFPDG